MSSPHASPMRGLMSATSSPRFQGRFGRLFRSLPAAQFGQSDADAKSNLEALGAAMTADPDLVKDGPDEEESGIPALYTYFGQFIDHDLTFDPVSALQAQNDPDALTDFRTPAFDLDCVYGRGPGDQPYMFDGAMGEFLLGDPISGGGDPGARDLPRNSAPAGRRRALIGDPRNDENVIVSQFQGLMLRFHNRIVSNSKSPRFAEAQQQLRFHYQYVVLNDFLPRIVHSNILDSLRIHSNYELEKLKFFKSFHDPFMPVEFSVAAYRFGHSMVRPGYRLNDKTRLPIFPTDESKEGLTGFREMNPNWAIDWGRLIDIEKRNYSGSSSDDEKRLQFAYRIDTSLVNSLSRLPPAVVPPTDPPPSLAARNLLRGWRLGLPSGQSVARKMGLKPLADNEILIGKAVDDPEEGDKPQPIRSISPVFRNNCPLWAYVLAEAMQHREEVDIPVVGGKRIKTPKLGPVGGRIVAEVFLGLMFADTNSLLSVDPKWKPDAGEGYGLKDFVRYALGK